jgi:hypothetical protein
VGTGTMERTTVWMVALDGGDKRDVEGTLAEEDDGLVFTQESTGTIFRFPYAELTKVSRVMGSPVFVVRSGPDRNTAFYLSRPPPLGALGGQNRPGAPLPTASTRLRGSGKWRQRRENTRYLAATATNVREVRDEWVKRIKTALKERPSR